MTNEEAKEFLSHYICCCQYGNSPFDCDYAECEFGIAIRTLCNEEKPQGDWIPIKTRPLTEEEKEEYPDYSFMYDCKLPDDGEEVLVTSSCGYVRLDTFYRDDGCYFEYYCDEGDVVAWQPLPKPYKEAKDNE